MHHIVSDGWSIGIIYKELATLYKTYQMGQPSGIPELPLQYADYTIWRREMMNGEVLERLVSYWENKLSEMPVLNLATDRSRPPFQTYCGSWEPITLSSCVGKELKRLSQEK